MAKQQASQKFIFKISTTRLKKAKWNLTLTLAEARRNEEVISLNDSLMLRWIDELNGVTDAERKASEIKANIRALRKCDSNLQNRKAIRALYEELDKLQFKPDYMHLVVDHKNDLLTACKGFKINGIKYTRLLGTNGGVKMSTIVFVSERLAPELRKRIDNGRDTQVPMIPAKLEAYRALTCSGSTPVSMPHGILVVPDCETRFKEDIIMLSDEENDEPEMTLIKDYEVVLDESDGYGLMLPSLAKRWSDELKLDYVASGMNTRFSWEKGMVFTFDFLDFAERVAGGRYVVKDAWGDDVDIRNVELILTTSMVKLWNCYKNIDHYLECCAENRYTFGIPKVCPKTLESWRTTNYQFLQSYDLNEEQMLELISPTIQEIEDITSDDYRKALLFLRGTDMSDEELELHHLGFSNALMIEPSTFDDPVVKKRIYSLIERRIKDAKIGVVGVHGNYSILCGDPYALCQSIFGLPVTGLLSAGEIYNRYWLDSGADRVACFRAPMSTHENIAAMKIARRDDMQYWYQYMTTCTLVNAWDTLCQRLNGADKDGDLIFLTDNKVLVENIRPTHTIFCVQRKGEKKIVTEEDLVASNIASFGDDIGKTTNYITAMYDVQAKFAPGSEEYETLAYRIKCGQLFQQNCIDKVKGISCKPMPRYWHDYRSANRLPDNPTEEDVRRRDLNLRILAEKKPYFMKYIYPSVMKDYNTYTKNVEEKCVMLFRKEVQELIESQAESLTQEEVTFLNYYTSRMPVGVNDCLMNRICRCFEDRFGVKLRKKISDSIFNYEILKSGIPYKAEQKIAVSKLYAEHKKRMKEYCIRECSYAWAYSRDGYGARTEERNALVQEFMREALAACSNSRQLCDIALDICYKKEGSKHFVWDICQDDILLNLLEKNDYSISYPVLDPDGDIMFRGKRFSMEGKRCEAWAKLF